MIENSATLVKPENKEINLANASFGFCGWNTPQIYDSNGIITVISGYIYNRNEFDSETNDAAVFSNLYLKFGFQESLNKINGDFAIALYDSKCDKLLLARDRFGIKPLYYVITNELLGFASRPKPLLSLPGVTNEINKRYIAVFSSSHYRYFDNHPDETPFRDILQLPAAHVLEYSNGTTKISRYWDLQDLPDLEETENELAEKYEKLLFDSVQIRLDSVLNPAFTLSGGMDSSSILSSSVYLTGKKQYAFSTVYDDKTYDESADIKTLLNSKVEKWNSIPIGDPDVFNLVAQMIEVHDEPIATATWLSHFILCKEVSNQGFKALFGGLGGDELNAGEYEYFSCYFSDLKKSQNIEMLDKEILKWIEYHNHPIYIKNRQVVEDAFTRMVDFENSKCLADKKRLYGYAKVLNKDFYNIYDFHPIMEHPFKSFLKNRTYQDLTRETIPCCLRAEDRQTVAFGIDTVDPFLDYRLVEFMYRIPGRLKIRDGVTKYLLRKAMGNGILPDETRNRIKKTGWNAPAHIWFSGKGNEQLMDLVHSQKFKNRGIYNIEAVNNILTEHENIIQNNLQVDNHMMFLWQLINLELWFQYIEQFNSN
ncbi:MAG: asparagine synthase [Bacteroidia bacterium]|nr:asparagine synthase [Bacteroidia bacterium]